MHTAARPVRTARTVLIAVVAALAMVLTLGQAPAFAANGKITGKVVVGTTGQAGVLVHVSTNDPDDPDAPPQEFTQETGATGTFSFTGLPLGEYQLEIWADDGYATPWVPSFTLTTAKPTYAVPTIKRVLYKTGDSRVDGVVTDAATGLPLIASVVLNPMGNPFGYQTYDHSTDGDGAYVIDDVPALDYDLTVTADGYVSHGPVQVGVRSHDVVTRDIALVPANASISGHVEDVNGDPVEGVDIDAQGPNGSYGFGTTDEFGDYVIPDLGAGDYLLTLGGTGTLWKRQTLVVTAIAEHDTDRGFLVEPREIGTVSGKVTTTASSRPGLAGICTEVQDDTGEVVGAAWETDSSGEYFAEDVDAGEYTLFFWDCNYSRTPAYAGTFLGGGASLAHAETITVEEGVNTEAPDTAIAKGGAISGRVSLQASDGVFPLPGNRGLDATVYSKVDGVWTEFPDPSPFVGPGGVGDYLANGLPAGTYRVGFVDSVFSGERAFAPVFWPNAATVEAATDIVVTSNVQRKNVNATVSIPVPDVGPAPSDESELIPGNEDDITAPGSAKQGQNLTVDVGADRAGEWVAVWGHSTPTLMGTSWVKASKTGKVTVPVPSLPSGDHRLVVQDATGEVLGWSELAVAGGPYPADALGTVGVDSSTSTLQPVLGDWPLGTTFTYQWLRGTTVAGTKAAYPLTAADKGKAITLRVSATVPGYAKTTRASAAVDYTLVASPAQPQLVNAVYLGNELHVNLPSYTGPAGALTPSITYQWLRNGAAISAAQGGTAAAYTPTAAKGDTGKTISVRVTATSPGTVTSVTTSAATQPVGATPFDGWDSPLAPVMQSGMTLTAPSAGVTPSTGVTTKYQWYRGTAAVKNATKKTYVLTASDLNKTVWVRITTSRATFTTAVKNSTPVDYSVTQGALPTVSADAWQVGGTASVAGQSYLTKDGPLTPTTQKYQWLRNGAVITGATQPTYVLAAADFGKRISVRITVGEPGYLGFTSTTAAGPVVAKGVTTGTPTVEVVANGNGKISANVIGLTPALPKPALAFKWYRDNPADAAPAAVIPGATSGTYTLQAADAGREISVVVTMTRANFVTPVTVFPRTAGVDYTISAPERPEIGGTPQVGVELIAYDPVYYYPDGTTPFIEPTEAKYQWYRGTTPIAGAVYREYTPTAADLGKVLSVKLTPTAPGRVFRLAQPTSLGTAPVAAGVIDTSGTGSTFSINSSGLATAIWMGTPPSPAGLTYSYAWYREGVVAPVSKSKTYKLVAADTNKKLQLFVSVSKTGYQTVTEGPLDVNEVTMQDPIVVNGGTAPTVGSELSVSIPTFLHAGSTTQTVTYQWLRDDAPIAGATGASYTATGDDEGARLSVNVTVAAPLYQTTTFGTPKSDVVAPAP